MRTFLLLLFFVSIKLHATNYYYSNSGSDANDDLSQATPRPTLSNLRALLGSLVPGDSVLFKRGEVFYGYFNPSVSGTAADPIVFGAYGTGAKPVISAFNSTQPTWSQSGSILTATLSDAVAYPIVMLINGQLRGKARSPNTGFLNATAISQTWIKIAGLTGTPNYANGMTEVVTRNRAWITDVELATSQNIDTIFTRSATYTPVYPYYFLQNNNSFLDQDGEYTWDSTGRTAKFFWSGAQIPPVFYPVRDTLIRVSGTDYITFDNVVLEGANSINLYIDNGADHVTFQNSTSRYAGGNNKGPNYPSVDGISGAHIFVRFNSKYATIANDSLIDGLNSGIKSYHGSDSTTIYNNDILRNGIIDGLDGNSEGAGFGIYADGKGTVIDLNRIDYTGYIGIRSDGGNWQITRNKISNYCQNKDDGGAIYSHSPSTTPGLYSTVSKNITVDAKRVTYAMGMYFDANASYINCSGNSFINSGYAGIFMHYPSYLNIRDNTSYDSTSIPAYYAIDGAATQISFKNNILLQRDTTQPAYFHAYPAYVGYNSDSNRVMRPKAETGLYWTVNTSNRLTRSEWTTATGWDAASQGSPGSRVSDYTIIVYNPTTKDSTMLLPGDYTDSKGTIYRRIITVKSFESVVLFPITSLPASQFLNRRSKFKKTL